MTHLAVDTDTDKDNEGNSNWTEEAEEARYSWPVRMNPSVVAADLSPEVTH